MATIVGSARFLPCREERRANRLPGAQRSRGIFRGQFQSQSAARDYFLHHRSRSGWCHPRATSGRETHRSKICGRGETQSPLRPTFVASMSHDSNGPINFRPAVCRQSPSANRTRRRESDLHLTFQNNQLPSAANLPLCSRTESECQPPENKDSSTPLIVRCGCCVA